MLTCTWQVPENNNNHKEFLGNSWQAIAAGLMQWKHHNTIQVYTHWRFRWCCAWRSFKKEGKRVNQMKGC